MKFLKNNFKYVFQILIFIFVAVIVEIDCCNNLYLFVWDLIGVNNVNILKLSKPIVTIVLWVILLFTIIRKWNQEDVLNRGNTYHNYPCLWYLFCSKILNVTKCNLRLVPIWLQFKLILNDVFNSFVVGDENTYIIADNETVSVEKYNYHEGESLNLILEDTYVINDEQLPDFINDLNKIKISRNKGDRQRYYSLKFITEVVEVLQDNVGRGKVINIFSTLNSKHVLEIVNKGLKLGNRCAEIKVYVFQQESKDIRKFASKGKYIGKI